jgi:uncharacterized protein affecting Mg2+/Co2+ transport
MAEKTASSPGNTHDDSKKRPAPEDSSAPPAGIVDNASLDLTAFLTSVFLVGICSFLPLEDIFQLRLVSRQIKNILHGEGQEDLWKMVLQRDFEFSKDDLKEENRPIMTISGDFPEVSICPLSDNMLQASESLFDAVKRWKKASAWVFRHFDARVMESLRTSIQDRIPEGGKATLAGEAILCLRQSTIRAPYFIRAARVWQGLYRWCRYGPETESKDLGLPGSNELVRNRIFDSLNERGSPLGHETTDAFLGLTSSGALALEALFAFSTGQRTFEYIDTYGISEGTFCGVMGGYEAYSYYRSNFLSLLTLYDGQRRISTSFAGHDQHGKGAVVLDCATGGLSVKDVDNCLPVRLDHRENRNDELLLWLEEYVRRLTKGEIGVGVMGFRPNHPKGITLFPRFVPGTVPRAVCGTPVVSRTVTRGLEIIASAVFAPQMQDEFGFVYSIRIRLLTPDDGNEYVPASDRGFETCQLMRRHWEIVNYETEQTHTVDGEAVIGMKPTFGEGGYVDDGDNFEGTFQYQSCTGYMKHGKFGGFLTFEARSGNESPLQFNADVGFFALDSEPDFLY